MCDDFRKHAFHERKIRSQELIEIDTAVALVGSAGVVDDGSGLSRYGDRFLSRQTASLGGGTNEIARNIIGERILGFPREYAADRGVPFNQVKR